MEREFKNPLTGEIIALEPKADLNDEYEKEVAKNVVNQVVEPPKKKTQKEMLAQKLPPTGYAYRAPPKKPGVYCFEQFHRLFFLSYFEV